MRLPFLGRRGANVALIDGPTGATITYDDLDDLVTARSEQVGGAGGLAVVLCTNSVSTIVDYLGALTAGYAVMPLDAGISEAALAAIIESYAPDRVLSAAPLASLGSYVERGPGVFEPDGAGDEFTICSDLAILLSTSGSTGSPRMVRLTARNMDANTRSIAESLRLTPADRAITSMPLHYSYGLSVLNSHLAVGASLVVSDASVVDPTFWQMVKNHRVTSFAGVPYTFAMLRRLRYEPGSTPDLTKVTQAGGRLDPESITHFRKIFEPAGVDFFIMYGQTEAGPRISCLPPERLEDKLGSAGLPMNGGTFHVDEVDSQVPAGTQGEIIYVGPNVMLGYAASREELTCHDDNEGVLKTGDIGYLDDDGFLFITGRIKRIAKLFGTRVSLDEVEALMAGLGPVAVVGGDDKLHVHHQNSAADDVASTRKAISLQLKVPLAAIVMHHEVDFPVMPSGKVDYRSLTERHASGTGS